MCSVMYISLPEVCIGFEKKEFIFYFRCIYYKKRNKWQHESKNKLNIEVDILRPVVIDFKRE